MLGLACFLCVCSVTLGVLFLIPHKPIIAFYNIPEELERSITLLAQDPQFSGKTQFRFQKLDGIKNLRDLTKTASHADILFTFDGKAAVEIIKKTIDPSEGILKLMPSAMQAAGRTDTRIYGLPLLLDHFEVAYNIQAFKNKSIKEPQTLDALLNAAKKLKTPTHWPIICAGKQDTDLLMLVGALLEARYGIDAWKNTVTLLQSEVSMKEIFKDNTFRAVLDELVSWRTKGLIHPEWFRMTNADIVAFMENDYSSIVLCSLSEHREVPFDTIKKFTSIYFPSATQGAPRAFTSPTLIGMRPYKKRPNKSAETFLYALARNSGQKKLGDASGLAPVNSTAETRDRQAADVRLWVASSHKPFPEIGTASFGDSEKRAQFAREIRQYIEADGVGY